MSPENTPKKVILDPQIIRDLWSEDEKIVMRAINQLRSRGNIHYIPELLRLLNNSGKEIIEKDLVRFLADIKNPAVKKILIAGLKDPGFTSARSNIVSVCWQSGIDYSQYLDIFIHLFRDGDYMTALECFTVIEETVLDMKRADIAVLQEQVVGILDQVSEEKKPLAAEMVKILEI